MLRATYKPVAHILFALVVLSPSPTGRCEGRCDFGPFKTLKKPALEPEVLDAFGPVALSYELDSLLPRHGNTQVLGGHAAIVVNGLGSSQQTFPLREWAATRNGSVIWDRGEIGADYLEWPLELPGALMQAVGEWVHGKKGSQSRVFSLGTNGTGLGFHAHGASMFVLLHGGQKLWAIAPPGTDLPPELRPTNPAAHGAFLLAALRREQYSWLSRSAGGMVLWCVQEAGEAVFLPSGWLHATFNLGDAVAGMAFQDNEAKGLVATAKQVLGGLKADWPRSLALFTLGTRGPEAPDFKAVKRALKLDPKNLGHRLGVAEMFARDGQNRNAARELNDAAAEARKLDGAGSDEVTSIWLASIGHNLCLLDRIDAGSAMIKEAVKRHPEVLSEHVNMAQLRKCLEAADE